MKVEQLTREFSYNGLTLADPGAQMSPEQVRDVYSAAYPEITSAAIEGPERKGTKLVYTFKRAVGTKGATPEFRSCTADGLTYIKVMPSGTRKPLLSRLMKAMKDALADMNEWLHHHNPA